MLITFNLFGFKEPLSVKRLKVQTFIYRWLLGNQNSSGLQLEVVYWPPLVVGSAVNEWTKEEEEN